MCCLPVAQASIVPVARVLASLDSSLQLRWVGTLPCGDGADTVAALQ